MVEIYTDGAAKGNPGPGGFGVIMKYKNHVKEFSEGYRLTTNNRMELMAVIKALEALKKDNLDVRITTDSKYVVDAVTKGWLFKWIKTGFKKKKNKDLWLRFYQSYKKHHIKFQWVKGHNEHPYNEKCDSMAVRAASGNHLLIDHAYENRSDSNELFPG